MADARWGDVQIDFDWAKMHFEYAKQLFLPEKFVVVGIEGYAAQMAFISTRGKPRILRSGMNNASIEARCL